MKLLSQIKKDMEFNLNLANLIGVLKEIAIFQYHVMEKKISSYDKMFAILQRLFDLITIENVSHPLLNLTQRTPGVIAVTSDTGLLGALNMQVMSLALDEVQANQAKLIIVGEKGKVYAQENNVGFVAFPGVNDEIRFAMAMQLRDYIINEELNQRLGSLKVIYPYAVSIMNQRIHSLQLLPFTPLDLSVQEERSRKGLTGFTGGKKAEASVPKEEIIMESRAGDIAGYLIYLLLGQKFYEIFGLSRLAEMAARFVHLEDSEHKLEDMKKELKLQYFKQRHELIDRNMRELFAARLAFK